MRVRAVIEFDINAPLSPEIREAVWSAAHANTQVQLGHPAVLFGPGSRIWTENAELISIDEAGGQQ